MASVTAAVLCDFAQVREHLLFVASGGINRATPPQVPAPLGIMLAALIEVGSYELDRVHSVVVTVKSVDDAKVLLRGEAGVQVQMADYEPGEVAQLPVVVDLRPLAVPRYGQYDIQISVDGEASTMLPFWVKPPPER